MAGVLTRHRPRRRRDIQTRCTCGIVNGDCEEDRETASGCSGSAGVRKASCFLRDDCAEVFVSGEAKRILIIGFQPRLLHVVLFG
jgi:hypothetical protein